MTERAKPLAAVVHVKGVELSCPHCTESLTEPRSGSYVWEIEGLVEVPATVTCACGQTVRIPKRLRK
jgi:hypothetical protein